MTVTPSTVSPIVELASPWFRRRGLIAGIVLSVATALSLVSTSWIEEDTWLELGVDIVAWVTFLLGAALRLWATLYVGGRKEQTLVTEGPYSITRNPLYGGSFLMALALGIFLQSLIFIVAVVVVAWVHMALTVRAEERGLRAIHGAAFDAYCAATPGFIPSFRRFHSPATVTVNIAALRREMSRLVRWFLLAVSMDSVAHLREQPWWPHLLHLR